MYWLIRRALTFLDGGGEDRAVYTTFECVQVARSLLLLVSSESSVPDAHDTDGWFAFDFESAVLDETKVGALHRAFRRFDGMCADEASFARLMKQIETLIIAVVVTLLDNDYV